MQDSSGGITESEFRAVLRTGRDARQVLEIEANAQAEVLVAAAFAGGKTELTKLDFATVLAANPSLLTFARCSVTGEEIA